MNLICLFRGHIWEKALIYSYKDKRRIPFKICSRCFKLRKLPRKKNIDIWEKRYGKGFLDKYFNKK